MDHSIFKSKVELQKFLIFKQRKILLLKFKIKLKFGSSSVSLVKLWLPGFIG